MYTGRRRKRTGRNNKESEKGGNVEHRKNWKLKKKEEADKTSKKEGEEKKN